MRISRIRLGATAVVVAVAALAGGTTSASAATVAVEPSATEREVPDVVEGDRILLRRLSVFVTVPPAGQSTSIASGIINFRVRNRNGRVLFRALLLRRILANRAEGDSARSRLGRATSNANQCSNAKYVTLDGSNGPAWPGTYSWRISTAGRPSNITQSQFLSAVKNAGAAWAGLKNPCGKPDVSSLTNRHTANSTNKTEIVVKSNGTWGCGTLDGVSEIGWARATASGASGLACTTWFTSDSDGDGRYDIKESDVALNSRYSWVAPGASCSGTRFFIDEVLTHEFGHAVGLGHGPAAAEVMYPYHSNCSRVGVSLAAGDHSGGAFLY